MDKNDKRLKGEVNAGLTYTGCARKLRRDYPHDVKMIFMLRDPVDRSYSAYKYFLARGFLPTWAYRYDEKYGHAQGFDYYVHRILDDPKQKSQIMNKRLKYLVFSQSNYGACIAEYLNGFELKNMDFVIFERFIVNEQEECKRIYDFLGVSGEGQLDRVVKSNEGNNKAVSAWRAKQLYLIKGLNYAFYDLLAMPYWAAGLYGRFKRYYKDVRKKCLAPDTDKSKILPSTRKYLMDYYSADIEKLERLTGKDLSAVWRKNGK